jgi:Fur family ferric uptake transcriptional regulator
MEIETTFQFHPPDGASLTVQDMLTLLMRAGYSNTRARRAVLMALCSAGGQASPATLLALGRAYHTDLGLVTVYRTLDILSDLGLVRKLHLDAGCHTYAISAAAVQTLGQAAAGDASRQHRAEPAHRDDEVAGQHSHHIICQRCQRAVEFAGCDMSAVAAAVESQTGFQVESHWLELFGICPECRVNGGA